ncbi:MAG TPA: adenylate kinase [Anaerolineae bacterium]|nr:adenylate kinase [Anaerolineae bacterium]
MADYILLFGPPGVGKGTQAELLIKHLELPHIATGDLFRDHLKRETALGRLAKDYMARGELVPDAVTIGMLKERIEQPDAHEGALLDGFPRTAAQADALARLLAEEDAAVCVVLFISAPTEVLLERLTNRWTCSQCGAIYNMVTNPPRTPGICDRCGGAVTQRADDNPEVHRKRIHVYLEQTMPLVDYYRQHGLLVEIDGRQSIEAVQRDILDAIARSKCERAEA